MTKAIKKSRKLFNELKEGIEHLADLRETTVATKKKKRSPPKKKQSKG